MGNPLAGTSKGAVRKSLKRFLILVVPFVFLLSAISFWLYLSEITTLYVFVKLHETHLLEHQHQYITQEIAGITEDLRFLAHESEERLALLGEDAGKKALAEEFLNFCRSRKAYDQIRFLDASGMEVVRVNYNGGNPRIVPDEQLQPKGSRYYFLDTIKNAPGELYASPLDLNIERQEIERPFKPMIRFATVVGTPAGEKAGIVILNYASSPLLRSIEATNDKGRGQVMLLNADGFWLKSADPADEWGFMFKGKENLTFGNRFPRVWQKINSVDTGQFQDQQGVFTFLTVRPMQAEVKSSSGSPQAAGASAYDLQASQYYWKLVSYVSSPELAALNHPIRKRISLYYGIGLGLLVLGAWFTAKAQIKQEQAQEWANQFANTLDQTMDCIFMFAPDTLRFTYVNKGAMAQVGYQAEEFYRMTPLSIKPEFTEERFREMIAPLVDGSEDSLFFETCHRHKNGSLLPVEIQLQLVRHPEQGDLFVAVVRDISRRKEDEKAIAVAHHRLIDVLDNVAGLVYVIDIDTYEIRYANRYLQDIFGEVEGTTCWQSLWTGKTGPCSFCPIATLKELPYAETGKEYVWEVLNDKVDRWYRNHDRVILWQDGSRVKIQIATDITEQKQLSLEREKLITELQEANSQIKTLRGIVPICAYCKKIRDDQGYWQQVEKYVSQHTDAQFSHGICQQCMDEHFPELKTDS